ncbi:response regulator transcription factor [Hydromonas duriensis]|uniref:LuxR family two component transcriptional regulator n=1 Tax=Hydromonas duriensis TaxID=1527608 RepID=A0A4R6Y703_9BURK|nr:response regulator [Hydromonas duriensis]TDR30414.1 LuxR family two component transcriptional regulator [Hydromonas duriensis]
MIYIIDDNDEMRRSLSSALKNMEYSTIEFSSAIDFLDKVESPAVPAVILLDMQMVNMSGIELQERLIAKQCHTPIIFISGESRPQQIIDSLHNGAYRFLLKPFDLTLLKELIDKALTWDKEKNMLVTAYSSLTAREKEVFVALANGKMVKQIALEREVSESVIKLHKAQVMKKFDIKSLQALTSIYNKLDLDS